jgi:hypothetical protein
MSTKFESQPFRDKLDLVRKQFDTLYQERMPILRDYEDFAHTTIDQLISTTVPQAQQIFRDAVGYNAETSAYLKQAQQFDTPERRQAESGKAMADVTSAAEQARSNSIAQLESFGIDPSQTRSAAMDQNLRVQTALEAVRAGKAARDTVEGQGREYTAQALGIKGEGIGREATAAATSADIMGHNAGAASGLVGIGQAVTGVGAGLIGQKQGIIESTATMKQAEQASKLAAKSGEAAGFAGIGQAVGTIGGAAIGGYLGSAGGPMGTMAGAQMGASIGGAAGSGMGGQASRNGF